MNRKFEYTGSSCPCNRRAHVRCWCCKKTRHFVERKRSIAENGHSSPGLYYCPGLGWPRGTRVQNSRWPVRPFASHTMLGSAKHSKRHWPAPRMLNEPPPSLLGARFMAPALRREAAIQSLFISAFVKRCCVPRVDSGDGYGFFYIYANQKKSVCA